MSSEERLSAFIHEVSTEVMEIDSNLSEVIPQDQPSLNTEVQEYLPVGTSLAVTKDKIKKTRKMVKIFSDDPSRIQFVCLFFVDQLSTFNEDNINFIKSKLPKPEMS
ncbi:12221_t:CDS:2 [Funneliformis mosseae]|uniref:12221_t:CDS:1 n=1 Tax=Funneliformis mosseae TaxID=27381 RepID=A0A9N9H9W9_FUNMO|nr:12221_t:CDS:2 [Funneliformis mosseae]